MKTNSIITFPFCLALLLMVACNQGQDSDVNTGEQYALDFVVAQPTALLNPPADYTTFRMMAFTAPIVSTSGTYHYLASDPRAGTLIPCAVNAAGVYQSTSNANGLILGAGTYQIAVISPALPFTTNMVTSETYIPVTIGQTLSVMPIFPISVTGYQIFSFPLDKMMKDVRTSLSVNVYQAGTTEFTVNDPLITNHGSAGKYYPYAGETRPDAVLGDDIVIPLIPTGDSGEGNKIYTTQPGDEVMLFAADYTSSNLVAPELAFDCVMGSITYPVRIPILYHLKPMMRYAININIKSIYIEVSLTAFPWEDGSDDTNDVGTPPFTISLGTWSVAGWVPGQSDNETIG